MSEADYNIEIMVDGPDHVVAIKPPVDVAFRERIYDVLDGMGLMKEIVIRGGNFFETKHLSDGSPYSELRVSNTALSVTGQNITNIAHQSGDALREQNKTVEVSPYLLAAGGSQGLFDRLAPDS